MTDDTAIAGLAELDAALVLVGLGLLAGALVLGVVAWALYKAGNRSRYAALSTSLALIGAGAVMVYAIGGEGRAEAVPIASLAIGALAAALGQMSSQKSRRSRPPEPAEPDVDTPKPPTKRKPPAGT